MLKEYKTTTADQSYPDRVHGGVISRLLDEAIECAIREIEPKTWGVTMELNIKFRKPVPLDTIVLIHSNITQNTHRGYNGEAKITDKNGTVYATASGKFFKLPPNFVFGKIDPSK